MKLIEAMEILKKGSPDGAQPLRVSLVCGFTPLHLQTFLTAHLKLLFPDRRVEVEVGTYGDFIGNLDRLGRSATDAGAVVLEWADLDPRLGIRSLGGWSRSNLKDILENARAQSARIQQTLAGICASGRNFLAICLPTLPVPPVSYAPTWQGSAFDTQLRECFFSFATFAADLRNVRIINPQIVDLKSPVSRRLDVKSELSADFPYGLNHAACVAELLARLIRNPAPKKGLITDLDDTLWSGIVGEVGVQGISWDLDHHSHMHGLLQQLLKALAEEGVLLAVASKNNASTVKEAFQRPDLILPQERVFPIEADWGPKSEMVARILRRWNVAANSIVFVDDSPMDLAEVKAAYPDMECLAFPSHDVQAAYELLARLRDLFGKNVISEEDTFRLESIRRSNALTETALDPGGSPEAFLKRAESQVIFSYAKIPPDPRVLELVNKTNQFNLNGRRYLASSWQTCLDAPGVFLLVVSYSDKYGPLGKIAVMKGRTEGRILNIDTWVMSCRAFSRRIEHRCLQELFENFDADEILFDFLPTTRNSPLQEFFAEFIGAAPRAEFALTRRTFAERCPPLSHRVTRLPNG
jgi:FkbH-like protein